MSDSQSAVLSALHKFTHVLTSLQTHEEKQHVIVYVIVLIVIMPLSVRGPYQAIEIDERVI